MAADAGFHLDVGEGHRLWVVDWGARAGTPILYLHGGPGGGCAPSARELFDPVPHRVIFVDQRGAGQSLPARALEANTTDRLIADLETVRAKLGLRRWLLVGGSWGATLALAYAQAHPERVSGLVLRAVFLGTRVELDWAFDTALAAFFPEHHAALMALVPGEGDPLAALWRRILDPAPERHRPAAMAFYRAERAMSHLTSPSVPDPDTGAPLPASPFIEAHYFLHDCFLAPDALIRGAGRLQDTPGVIIQARQDLLCPPATSERLAARWPRANRVMVEAAGHSIGHPAILDAMREAVAELSAATQEFDPRGATEGA